MVFHFHRFFIFMDFYFDVRYGSSSGAKADFDVGPGWVLGAGKPGLD
jgi:hypothetical protein